MRWKSFKSIPSDREVLIAYGTVKDGPLGHAIVRQLGHKWFSRDDNAYPHMDWIIIGWMDLPPFPKV